MSLESAKKFVEKMQQDNDFAKSFFACTNHEGRKEFLKVQGFEFTKQEIDEVRQTIDISGGNSCCGRTCEHDHQGPFWDK